MTKAFKDVKREQLRSAIREFKLGIRSGVILYKTAHQFGLGYEAAISFAQRMHALHRTADSTAWICHRNFNRKYPDFCTFGL